MKTQIAQTAAEFDHIAAGIIKSAIESPSTKVIGLSTGRTTGNMHRIVAQMYKDTPFDASDVTLFAIDEVTGIPRQNGWACYTKLRSEIIDDLGIDDSRFLALPTESEDFETAAVQFYAELQDRGGIDLIMLGIGENGHLGFNQPGSAFIGGPHVSTMDKGLEDRIRKDCELPEEAPVGGVTLTIEELMSARRIVLVAKGLEKAPVLDKVLNGPVTCDVPASILQNHPDCLVLMDSEAASVAFK